MRHHRPHSQLMLARSLIAAIFGAIQSLLLGEVGEVLGQAEDSCLIPLLDCNHINSITSENVTGPDRTIHLICDLRNYCALPALSKTNGLRPWQSELKNCTGCRRAGSPQTTAVGLDN